MSGRPGRFVQFGSAMHSGEPVNHATLQAILLFGGGSPSRDALAKVESGGAEVAGLAEALRERDARIADLCEALDHANLTASEQEELLQNNSKGTVKLREQNEHLLGRVAEIEAPHWA